MHPGGQADEWSAQAGRLPERHPDAPKRHGVRGWVRRRVLARIPPWRHYDAAMRRLDRMDARHEHDFSALFDALAEVQDALAVVRRAPETLAIGHVLAVVERIETDARDHHAQQRESWASFMREMSAAAQQFGDASNRMYFLTQRMLDEA